MTRSKPSTAMAVCLLLSLAASGCGWFEDPTPENLRLRLSGPAGTTVDVVTSTQFVASVDEAGVTHVSLVWADTVRRSLPFDTTAYIGIDRRFFVEVTPVQPDPATVDVLVEVDGRVQVSEKGSVEARNPWRYAYLFNQRITRVIDTRI